MNDTLAPFFYLIGIAVLVWWLIRVRSREGMLTLDKKYYTYTLGDNLEAEIILTTGKLLKFKGIDIRIDKPLPHIYLDSHHDSLMSGPRFYISKKQKVSLEGNFDKYFQLYAADGYKQLALSIITPDVMQTLISSAYQFDVEIKGTHLRLISQHNVFKRKKREEALLEAARLILTEIAHRLQSWKASEIKNVHDTQLHVVPEQTFKFGKQTYRLAYLFCTFIGLFFSLSWIIATSASGGRTGVQEVADHIRVIGVLVCLAAPFILLFTMEYWERHSPRTYQAFFNYFK